MNTHRRTIEECFEQNGITVPVGLSDDETKKMFVNLYANHYINKSHDWNMRLGSLEIDKLTVIHDGEKPNHGNSSDYYSSYDFSKNKKLLDVAGYEVKFDDVTDVYCVSGPIRIEALIMKPNSIAKVPHMVLLSTRFTEFDPYRSDKTTEYWFRSVGDSRTVIGVYDIDTLSEKDLEKYILICIYQYLHYQVNTLNAHLQNIKKLINK